jgi:hypothetical protein
MISAKRNRGRPMRSTALLIGLFLTGSAVNVAGQADNLAKELPRIAPRSPAESMKSFRIHDGFHLEAVAVEPMVTNPVSACYDEYGRLYVVQKRGYP